MRLFVLRLRKAFLKSSDVERVFRIRIWHLQREYRTLLKGANCKHVKYGELLKSFKILFLYWDSLILGLGNPKTSNSWRAQVKSAERIQFVYIYLKYYSRQYTVISRRGIKIFNNVCYRDPRDLSHFASYSLDSMSHTPFKTFFPCMRWRVFEDLFK